MVTIKVQNASLAEITKYAAQDGVSVAQEAHKYATEANLLKTLGLEDRGDATLCIGAEDYSANGWLMAGTTFELECTGELAKLLSSKTIDSDKVFSCAEVAKLLANTHDSANYAADDQNVRYYNPETGIRICETSLNYFVDDKGSGFAAVDSISVYTAQGTLAFTTTKNETNKLGPFDWVAHYCQTGVQVLPLNFAEKIKEVERNQEQPLATVASL